jgi:predicted enzyme related to lactoylglutathione lyase
MVERDTPWAPGTPCWVDLMTTDQAAARSFYGELFGWDVEVGPPETGEYGMASIGGRSVAGIGGMMGMEHPPVWNTYLASADADATVQAVEAAGGSVQAPAMDVMEFGRMAVVQVPGGGFTSVWQAGSHIGMSLANETGAVVWNEFMTRDFDAATKFFTDVFGYTYTDMSGGGFVYATAEVDGNTIGGVGQLPDFVPAQVPPHWRVYFAVDDADAAVAKVTDLGGSVINPPQDMPYGRHAAVADPQGANFCVIKPGPGPDA